MTWPMTAYLAAWRTFRRVSNENAHMAAHIVALASWPRHTDQFGVCDLGCGDGRLLDELIGMSASRPGRVRLVDTDDGLLSEATRQLASCLPPRLSPAGFLGRAEDLIEKVAEGMDVLLLIHVVYLMETHAVRSLLERIPRGVPMIVVLDEPESVFAELWRVTAPQYSKRVELAHGVLGRLPVGDYEVRRTSITSFVPNPFTEFTRHTCDLTNSPGPRATPTSIASWTSSSPPVTRGRGRSGRRSWPSLGTSQTTRLRRIIDPSRRRSTSRLRPHWPR